MFKRSLIGLAVTLVLFASACVAKAEDKKPAGQPVLVSHDLNVSFDLQKHLLIAEDKITFEANAPAPKEITLFLNKTLKVASVKCNDKDAAIKTNDKIDTKEFERNEFTLKGSCAVIVTLPEKLSGKFVLTVSYSGEIYDPVMKAGGLRFVVADQTSGLISEDGIFLHGPSLWYPTTPFAFATFNVTSKTPEKWVTVSQGELASKTTEGGFTTMRWESKTPADNLALFAAERVMKEKKIGGVKIYTFFSDKNSVLADLYLNKCGEYIAFFSKELGDYPYKTFSVAENFFSSGFGMPTFTLLGPMVISRGATNEYDLGHEIAHNYWGNGCFSSPESSNWCEGLTVYTSNYYFLEKQKGYAEAINFRQKKSMTYTMHVTPGTEYPLGKFMYKTKELDNQVGYMQSAMTFHAVRKMIGDEAFFKGLRHVVDKKMYQYVGWNDFREAFEKYSKQDLGWFFKQALEKPGIPQVKLANVTSNQNDKGEYVIKGTVQQVGETYRFNLPLAIYTEKETHFFKLELKDKETPFSFTVNGDPLRLELDPVFDVIRRLNPDEMPACMLATMKAHPGKLLVVLPTKGDPKALETFKKLADKLATMEKATVKNDTDVTDAELAANSLFIFGKPDENTVFEKMLPKLEGRVGYTKNGPYIGKLDEKAKMSLSPMGALLVSDRNPYNQEFYYTAFAPQAPAALDMLGMVLFFYDTYGYIMFEAHMKVAVGQYPPPKTSTTFEFAAARKNAK